MKVVNLSMWVVILTSSSVAKHRIIYCDLLVIFIEYITFGTIRPCLA